MGILAELRAATRGIHDRLEQLPYARSVLDGSLALESYVGFLRASYVMHENLERSAAMSGHPAVRAVWRDDMRRAPLLARDLAYFAAPMTAADVATLQAELVAQQIRLAALEDGPALLGCLYVFEGAALGGLAQRTAVARRFGLTDGGIAYLSADGAAVRARFDAFVERLDSAVRSDADRASVVAAAQRTFEGVESVVSALCPSGVHTAPLVAVLNHDAGRHPISEDLREIEAALRAGEASWQAVPYYEARYGERGRRFTRSDSAWLAMVCHQGPELVRKHVFWLGRVLGARGMPRWLLERHLENLHAALVSAVPESRERYDLLRDVARELREARLGTIPEARFWSLAASFDARIGPEVSPSLPGAGALAVAAVADERAGIAQAGESVESWLADRRRFPEVWVDAVHATFAAARAS